LSGDGFGGGGTAQRGNERARRRASGRRPNRSRRQCTGSDVP
jgi:hypothetical protein